MIYLFFAFILIVVFAVIAGSQNSFRSSFWGGYLSRDNTQSIKGIFIIIVFFSHFNSYVEYTSFGDKAYLFAINQIGQMMVTMFLFYSGYGVMESIRKKGNSYINTIPKHRVLGTLLKFDIVVCIYVLLAFILGQQLTFGKICGALIAWESVGNSNWYIFAILLLYMITYIAGKISNGTHTNILIVVTVLTILYIAVLMMTNYQKAQFYNTVICYPLGMAYSIYREPFEELLSKKANYVSALVLLLLLLVLTKAFIKVGTSPLIIVEGIFFSLFIVALSMKIPLKSKLLAWCGNYLFELYIFQRLSMLVLKRIGVADISICLFFIFSFISTIILALLYRRSTRRIRL